MARDALKVTYIVILCFTIIFAMVELGLAADLTWEINRSLLGFSSPIRARTRYLVFCSSWTILAGLLLAMFMTMDDPGMAILIQVIVMFISMVLWLIGAALFTSIIGGSGLSCVGGRSCFIVNMVNATMAFAWINWSFVMIAFTLALALAFFGRHRERGTKQRPMTTTTATPNAGVSMPQPQVSQP